VPYLYKTARKEYVDDEFFVFDIETVKRRGDNEETITNATPRNFLFGAIYGANHHKVFYSIKDFKKEIEHKRYKNKILFAHNAEYDLSGIFGNIYKNLDPRAIFNGRFICANYNHITFADSFNIFPSSVGNIGKELGLQKMELEYELLPTNKRNITQEQIDYCIRDCEIVWKALQKIFQEAGAVRLTLAGLSLDFFRNTYLKHSIKFNDTYNDYFFNSYYGGRVEAFRLGKVKAYKYDVNSMYPFAMVKAIFPNPDKLKSKKEPSPTEAKYLIGRYEGVIHCQVEHEKSFIGLLPYKRDGKLIFPTGVFTGWWNFNEIRYAISTKRVKIIHVEEIVYAPPYETPFNDYVIDLYNKRKNSTGIYKSIYKLLMNSLYGKFAQRIKYETTYFPEIPYERIQLMKELERKFNIKLFSSKRKDCFIELEKANQYTKHTIPIFASYITSFARIELLKYLIKHEKDICYCDTDSIALTTKQKYNSSELGGLKMEPAIITEIRGNKNYIEIENNETKLKLKGVPKKHTKIQGKYRYQKMTKTKEALRRNTEAGTFNFVEKEISELYDKRIINKQKTEPHVIDENDA